MSGLNIGACDLSKKGKDVQFCHPDDLKFLTMWSVQDNFIQVHPREC